MRIGFVLNSHWAIRLLNRFESGFNVNRPLVLHAIYKIPGNLPCDHNSERLEVQKKRKIVVHLVL